MPYYVCLARIIDILSRPESIQCGNPKHKQAMSRAGSQRPARSRLFPSPKSLGLRQCVDAPVSHPGIGNPCQSIDTAVKPLFTYTSSCRSEMTQFMRSTPCLQPRRRPNATLLAWSRLPSATLPFTCSTCNFGLTSVQHRAMSPFNGPMPNSSRYYDP